MPLYEYECLECGTRFEVIQRLKERALKKFECDECGEVRPVKKLLSAPAFQFKGEGWYVTDYADKKGKDGKKSDSDSKSKGEETKESSGKKGSTSSEGSSKDKDKSEGSTKKTSSAKTEKS